MRSHFLYVAPHHDNKLIHRLGCALYPLEITRCAMAVTF